MLREPAQIARIRIVEDDTATLCLAVQNGGSGSGTAVTFCKQTSGYCRRTRISRTRWRRCLLPVWRVARV